MQTIRQNLSRYRNEIKGVAILWVVFFHAQLGLDGFLYQIQRIGYGGVDIFFFLSGYGLYHSLSKDADLGRYMKRRSERLLPSYLPFCLLWLAVMLPMYGGGIATSARIAMSNLSMLSFLTGTPLYINWYTGALLMSMVLAPFFYVLVKPGKKYWLRALGLLAVLFAVGLGYIDDSRYMFICRLPVMVLGMIVGGCTLNSRKLRWGIPMVTAGSVLALAVLYRCLDQYKELLVTYAMYWHPFVLIAPVLCIGLGWLFSHVPVIVLKPLNILGRASFEIFLFNAWVETLGVGFGVFSGPVEWLLWSGAGIVVGLGYHMLISKAWKTVFQKNKKVVDN